MRQLAFLGSVINCLHMAQRLGSPRSAFLIFALSVSAKRAVSRQSMIDTVEAVASKIMMLVETVPNNVLRMH
jgi:hypothetical protein